MTAVVVRRRDRKLAVFRELLEERLGKDTVDAISHMVKQMTVRIQQATIREDHSIALSSHTEGNIRLIISRRGECLWSGFLPAEDMGNIKYNTGHDLVIVITRDGPNGFYMLSRGEEDEPFYAGWSDIAPQYLEKGESRQYEVDGFDLRLSAV